MRFIRHNAGAFVPPLTPNAWMERDGVAVARATHDRIDNLTDQVQGATNFCVLNAAERALIAAKMCP